VLDHAKVTPAVAAPQKLVTNDFCPVWGTDAELTIVPKGTQPSNGSWWLVLLDDSDQANALGYHDLTTEGLPIGKVSASDLKAGTSWTVTASHELLEMLGHPNVNLTVFVQNSNTAGILYAYEVRDACRRRQPRLPDRSYPAVRFRLPRRGLKVFGRRFHSVRSQEQDSGSAAVVGRRLQRHL
jgi:hypothetical protein